MKPERQLSDRSAPEKKPSAERSAPERQLSGRSERSAPEKKPSAEAQKEEALEKRLSDVSTASPPFPPSEPPETFRRDYTAMMTGVTDMGDMDIATAPVMENVDSLLAEPAPAPFYPEGFSEKEVTMREAGDFAVDPVTSSVFIVRHLNYNLESDQERNLENLGLVIASKDLPPLTEPYTGIKYDIYKFATAAKLSFTDPDALMTALTKAILRSKQDVRPVKKAFWRGADVGRSVIFYSRSPQPWLELQRGEVMVIDDNTKEPAILHSPQKSLRPHVSIIGKVKDPKSKVEFERLSDGSFYGRGYVWKCQPARTRMIEPEHVTPRASLIFDTVKFLNEHLQFGGSKSSRATARAYKKSLDQAKAKNDAIFHILRQGAAFHVNPEALLVVERSAKRLCVANPIECTTPARVFSPAELKNATEIAHDRIKPGFPKNE